MKIKINNKYLRWGLTAFLVLISAITFTYFMFNNSKIIIAVNTIIKILMPVVVGMAIAYLLAPLLNFIEKKLLYPAFSLLKIKKETKNKIVRILGILLTVIIVLSLLYLFFYMIISQIVPSVQNIVLNFDSYTKNIMNWLDKLLKNNPKAEEYVTKTISTISEELELWIKELLPNTVDVLKKVSISLISGISALANYIIGFIISIYVLLNKESFSGQAKKAIYAFFENRTANTILKNLRFTHKTFIGFLGGKIIDSIIIGILCFIGTSILKLPYAALVSVIIGITNIIPFFGPFLGAVPSALLIFMVNPMHPINCLYFIIFVLILQQIDGNIIGPIILGDSTGLSGFWVIFSITLFGGLFGVLGMVIGIPFFAVLYAGIRTIFNNMLINKNLPIDSSEYIDLDYIDEEGIHRVEICETINKANKKIKKNKNKETNENEISNPKS